MAPLSKRAQALYERVRQGRFYRTYDAKLPAAMSELIEAGLVTQTMRVETIVACYFPANGYTPYAPESFVEPLPANITLPADQDAALRKLIEGGAVLEIVNYDEAAASYGLTPGITVTVSGEGLGVDEIIACETLREAGVTIVEA